MKLKHEDGQTISTDSNYVELFDGDNTVKLDGRFSADDLRQILEKMERPQEAINMCPICGAPTDENFNLVRVP